MKTEPEISEPLQRRGQFALRSLLLLFVALQVFLGLTAFLKHIGFVIACYGIVAGFGCWLGKWRVVTAATTGLLVFVSTYLACWIGMGYQSQMHYRNFLMVYRDFQVMDELLTDYHNRMGQFPDSLKTAVDEGDFHFERDEAGSILGPWYHPYHYEKTADGFELVALGRDGGFGGSGLDADIHFEDLDGASESRLPLRQYLFETPASGGVFIVALLASLSAAYIWFGTQQVVGASSWPTALGILVTTASAVVVAFFLAGFHIAASQSGH